MEMFNYCDIIDVKHELLLMILKKKKKKAWVIKHIKY